MELVQYFSVLRKWYRLILLSTLLAGFTALIVSFTMPPTYEAEAYMAIVKSGTQLNFDPKYKTITETDLVQQAIDQTARRKSLTTMAKSLDIAMAVTAKIGDRLDDVDRILANLLGSIDAVNDGDLIKIKAKANSAEKAALVANAWAQEYESRVNAVYAESVFSPAEFQSQADAAKRDYDEKQAALVAYLADNPLDELTRQIEQKRQRLADLVTIENKIDRLLGDATALKSRLSFGTPGSSRGDELARILLEASAFSTWANLPGKQQGQEPKRVDILPVTLQIPMDQLSAGTTPAEQLRALDALIATLEERRKTVQAEIVGPLQQEVNQLQAQLEQENAKKQELTRARDLAWSTYTTLANKVAELNVAAQARGTVVRLAVPAVAPESPVAPKKMMNTLLASVVGLMLGVGVAFLFAYLNDNVTDEDQVTTLLGLATIGAIPEIPRASVNSKAKDGQVGLVVQTPRSPAAEAFCLLRHNLSANGANYRVLLLASAVPGEGKSTVVANLAAVLARTGKTVTLVDADFRRPAQHKIFGLKNGFGLYDLLNDSPDNWAEHSQATNVEGLRLISSGPLPPDPARLLEGPALGRLIEKLKAASDVVVIDTPAVLGLADAPIVAHVADALLLVVESDGVSRRDALRAKEALASTGVPIVGVVLNRTAVFPGALAYEYYASPRRPLPAAKGQKGISAVWERAQSEWWPEVRDRVVDLVGPRRGG